MRVEEQPNYTLAEGDCFEFLNYVKDNSVDLILTDPPYGVTREEWDKKIDLDMLWYHFKRILKPGAPVVMTATQPFTTDLINSNRPWFKYCWVWDKHFPRGFQNAKHRPMMRHEDIVVFANGKHNYHPIMVLRDKPVSGKVYGKSKVNPLTNYDGQKRVYTHKFPASIIEGLFDPTQKKHHPTQKPVSLFEYLIKTYTVEGDTVLDPFAGGGTTAVAAIQSERIAICCEQDHAYFEVMLGRAVEANNARDLRRE